MNSKQVKTSKIFYLMASRCGRQVISVMLLAICAVLPMAAQQPLNYNVEEGLKEVDEIINNREMYVKQRHNAIGLLKMQLAANKAVDGKMFDHLRILADEYCSFNNDSAMHYYQLGRDLAKQVGDEEMWQIFNLRYIARMPLVGYTNPSITALNSVDTSGFSDEMKCRYHGTARQLYSYLQMMHSADAALSEEFKRLALMHEDSLIHYLPKDSYEYKFRRAESAFNHGNYPLARAIASPLLETLHKDSPEYASTAYLLSELEWSAKHEDLSIYYLTQSVLADIKSATLEVSSLQQLGKRMYERGDINRAYSYLTAGLHSAIESHSEMRVIESGGALAIIEKAHQAQLDASTQRTHIVIGVMVIVLLVLLGLLLVLRREMKRISKLRDVLRGANEAKEVYMSQFLQLCSIYMDKLNQFCKLANRKISTGKVDDLYKLTKSGRFIEEQSKDFYDVFDNAFLHLYPNFVQDINMLLRPEERYEMCEPNKLNTDLRILALMKMGIRDNGKIAELLNFSVNTIYAYRNRIKNKAIDRENFEDTMLKFEQFK